MFIYFPSLHVSSNPVPIIRRIICINTSSGILYIILCRWLPGIPGRRDRHTRQSPIHSDIYQMMYWYKWFSWWWALGCSKHVEKGNKWTYWKKCVKLVINTHYTEMHGQRNITFHKKDGRCRMPTFQQNFIYQCSIIKRKISRCHHIFWTLNEKGFNQHLTVSIKQIFLPHFGLFTT
jgi:hypothetical protein